MRGLFNLLVIIVIVQNARLILENFTKYGNCYNSFVKIGTKVFKL